MKSFAELKAHLDAKLCGAATIVLEPRDGLCQEPWAVADAFVTRHGLRPIQKRWQVISETTAHGFLSGMLHRSLAYREEWMQRRTAEHFATAFRALFDRHAVTCLSNGTMDAFGNVGWTPITGSTFELAVILHDDTHIGMIRVEDED